MQEGVFWESSKRKGCEYREWGTWVNQQCGHLGCDSSAIQSGFPLHPALPLSLLPSSKQQRQQGAPRSKDWLLAPLAVPTSLDASPQLLKSDRGNGDCFHREAAESGTGKFPGLATRNHHTFRKTNTTEKQKTPSIQGYS